ncbi:hypothetical protein SAMN05216371_0225 [Streptomyces sp. TLI_053]|uniref:hypothetical protein n=1 Tax=Streptomyces sp. TLI_053 TaxID=1855352 RepID=UPI000879A40B|nr:hypothetical protein [Streptomyces sp. TLI_053]SDS59305.1 hypothetical protein SAMN05216371_0225 [Streptomyces sp. TLI_053]
MADTTAPPTEPLHYAVDLTPADVRAIHAFLREQIRPLEGDAAFGSAEQRAARALSSLVRTATARAEATLQRLTDAPEDRHRTDNLNSLRQSWQSLVEAAEEWADTPGFDRRRWREVDADPAAAALRHRLVAKQRAESSADAKA